MITRLTLFIMTIAVMTSCQTGYKKENGKWVWISYDEAVGKRVTEIESIDYETFKILENENYAVDKNNVYHMTRPIKNSDPETFTILTTNGYSKDDQKVFLDWDEIIFADPKTFKTLNFPYSKDKDNIFCGTLPLRIPIEEINEFKVTSKDKLMSDIGSTVLKSHFIEQNSDYKWLDTLDIDGIIVGEFATGETKKRKFKGYREEKNDQKKKPLITPPRFHAPITALWLIKH